MRFNIFIGDLRHISLCVIRRNHAIFGLYCRRCVDSDETGTTMFEITKTYHDWLMTSATPVPLSLGIGGPTEVIQKPQAVSLESTASPVHELTATEKSTASPQTPEQNDPISVSPGY